MHLSWSQQFTIENTKMSLEQYKQKLQEKFPPVTLTDREERRFKEILAKYPEDFYYSDLESYRKLFQENGVILEAELPAYNEQRCGELMTKFAALVGRVCNDEPSKKERNSEIEKLLWEYNSFLLPEFHVAVIEAYRDGDESLKASLYSQDVFKETIDKGKAYATLKL